MLSARLFPVTCLRISERMSPRSGAALGSVEQILMLTSHLPSTCLDVGPAPQADTNTTSATLKAAIGSFVVAFQVNIGWFTVS